MGKSTKGKASGEVTIVDVANEAGVSYGTVSRVINNKGYVNAQTRENVLRAIAKLGYVANPQARKLVGGYSHMVGLLVHDLGMGHIGDIMRGIDAELSERNYNILLYTTHSDKIRESAYVATITQGMADGLIVVLPRNSEAYVKTLQQRRFPYVLIDHLVPDNASCGSSVGITNWQGAYDATSYLLDLNHRRIGCITGDLTMNDAVERLEGYKAALRDHGLAILPELIQEGDFFQPRAYTCAHTLLSLPEPPTAIFTSNDLSAFGAMEAVRDHGLRIPEDMSIIGFDDIPQAQGVHPPLTTIHQPLEQKGRTAAQMILKSIQDPRTTLERIVLTTELVIRGTCQRANANIATL